jgi:hypothetical protein
MPAARTMTGNEDLTIEEREKKPSPLLLNAPNYATGKALTNNYLLGRAHAPFFRHIESTRMSASGWFVCPVKDRFPAANTIFRKSGLAGTVPYIQLI